MLCYYCDTQLPGPEDVSLHMTGFHNINKHLDFILEVTSRRQKQGNQEPCRFMSGRKFLRSKFWAEVDPRSVIRVVLEGG